MVEFIIEHTTDSAPILQDDDPQFQQGLRKFIREGAERPMVMIQWIWGYTISISDDGSMVLLYIWCAMDPINIPPLCWH